MKKFRKNRDRYLDDLTDLSENQLRAHGRFEALQSLVKRARTVYSSDADLFIQQKLNRATQK